MKSNGGEEAFPLAEPMTYAGPIWSRERRLSFDFHVNFNFDVNLLVDVSIVWSEG